MSPISILLIKAFKRFKQKKLQIHEPDINKTDLNNLKSCINTRNVSAAGNFCKKFENELKKLQNRSS